LARAQPASALILGRVYSLTRRCPVLERSGNLMLDQSTTGFDPDRTTRRKPTRASAKATWNACVVKLRSASVPLAKSRM